MTTDTSKITTAADDLGDKLTKGGGAAKTLGTEIANAFSSLDARVAALEAGSVTPPDPVPPDSTAGKIENFDATSYFTAMTIGGQATKNINAIKSWSLLQVDDYTLKFEVRSGDVAKNSTGSWTDSPTSERSETELLPRYNYGQLVNIEYGMIVHSGSPNTSQWVVLGQFHTEIGPSCPCAVAMWGETMGIFVRGPNSVENRVWQDKNPIQRGHKYLMRLQIKFNPGGTGTINAWRDGSQIVKYSGAFGSGLSGDTWYWKEGVYRNHAPETMQASYSNLSVTAS